MKKFYFLLAFFFTTTILFSQNEFITTWEVTSDDLEIVIYTSSAYSYNYNIDFGDGTVLNNVTTDSPHTYATAGVYTVSITGLFSQFLAASEDRSDFLVNPQKLLSVEQWGNTQWLSMESSFYYCENMTVNATDVPDLSQVTNMSYMFYKCKTFNHPLSSWDVSNVTDTSYMFLGCDVFNQPLSSWNVSNVTDMSSMFKSCNTYNQPLDNWDVSSVTNMKHMFGGCVLFNQPLSGFNVSNVTDMSYMFSGCNVFNQPLDNWNVSNVTDMRTMFSSCEVFNQPLDNWDVSNVTHMNAMFNFCTEFNQPLSSWDVSNVTNMAFMFASCNVFNQPLDNWDVSNVTSMFVMFQSCDVFNQPLSSWNVSNVTNMSGMLSRCYAFNQPLTSWDVSNVTNMSSMFYESDVFNQSLESWDVSNVTNMSNMFRACFAFNQPLESWNVSNVTNMNRMFFACVAYNQSLDNWDFSMVEDLEYFASNAGLNVTNYDGLLLQLANSGIENLNIGVSNLEYCNVEARDVLLSNGCTFVADSLSSECSNVVSGMVYYDMDNNGCTNADLNVSNYLVQSSSSSSSSYTSTVVQSGAYVMRLYSEVNHTISLTNIPNYFTVNPETSDIDFSTGSTQIVNFCITANQTVEDLNITVLPINGARPGFQSDYKLIIENVGTEIIDDATVSFTFNEIMQSFVSATPSPAATTSNSLDFSLGTINPFQTLEVVLTMETFTPPTVNGDDLLNFTALISPNTNDNTPNDNASNLEQIVVNAYDPNDKRVLQGDNITVDETDNYLDYIIRFQNTGTANATFVRIEDDLDADLDWATIKITSASHDYDIKITNGNEVEFIFDNINLPYEAIDELSSNGFIAYKIKPKSTVQIGDVMSGNASIYFDYNLPIITNTVSTEVVNNLSVNEYVTEHLVSIYPNPTSEGVNIKVNNGVTLKSARLYSIQGKLLIETKDNVDYINTEKLSFGVYVLSIETNKGQVNRKVIIN